MNGGMSNNIQCIWRLSYNFIVGIIIHRCPKFGLCSQWAEVCRGIRCKPVAAVTDEFALAVILLRPISISNLLRDAYCGSPYLIDRSLANPWITWDAKLPGKRDACSSCSRSALNRTNPIPRPTTVDRV